MPRKNNKSNEGSQRSIGRAEARGLHDIRVIGNRASTTARKLQEKQRVVVGVGRTVSQETRAALQATAEAVGSKLYSGPALFYTKRRDEAIVGKPVSGNGDAFLRALLEKSGLTHDEVHEPATFDLLTVVDFYHGPNAGGVLRLVLRDRPLDTEAAERGRLLTTEALGISRAFGKPDTFTKVLEDSIGHLTAPTFEMGICNITRAPKFSLAEFVTKGIAPATITLEPVALIFK